MPACHRFLLVSNMVGIEGMVTVEFVMMIANLQTLGIPISMTSLPIVISAAASMVVIPLLGHLSQRYNMSRRQKAKFLSCANLSLLIGASLVLIANVMKLYDSPDIETAGNNYTIASPTFIPVDGNSIYPQAWSVLPTINYRIFSEKSTPSVDLISSRPLANTSYISHSNHTQNNIDYSVNSNSSSIAGKFPVRTSSAAGIKSYAILAIVGYVLVDSGYDTNSCLLKTFAMAATPSDDHPDVIVKATLVSSVGGCLVTLLVSTGIPNLIASRLSFDVNSVTCVFLLGLMIIVTLCTLTSSLVSGLCFQVTGFRPEEYDVCNCSLPDADQDKHHLLSRDTNENSFLGGKITHGSEAFDIPSQNSGDDGKFLLTASHNLSKQAALDRLVCISGNFSYTISTEKPANRDASLASNYYTTENGRTLSTKILEKSPVTNRMRNFLQSHWSMIILCAATYCCVGAMFSFNMYAVNFVASSIFHGNALAPSSSPEYEAYADGVTAASRGLLLFYTFFVVGCCTQTFLINKLGWWMDAMIIGLAYLVSTVTCVTSQMVEVFYVSCCVNGFFRAMVFSVPYVIVCRLSRESPGQDNTADGKETGNASVLQVSLVAAMLPLTMLITSPVLGALIEATGNTAIPLYYTSGSCLLGLALFSLLRNF